jgi:phenylacetate-CoA ligase
MKLDFSDVPLKAEAFDARPMRFLEPATRDFLATILEIVALETGPRAPREVWASRQTRNLLGHAVERSAFWRKRIDSRARGAGALTFVPTLSRRDLMEQVEKEGALVSAKEMAFREHATSGSSGTPVKFFISQVNTNFNRARSVSQFFIENRDLSPNFTKVTASRDGKLHVTEAASWMDDANKVIRCGRHKSIAFASTNVAEAAAELAKDPIGYLIVAPKFIEVLLEERGLDFLKSNGLRMWISFAEPTEPHLRRVLEDAGIPVRATYSSEEVGPIGFECPQFPDRYHVATSNVIVEINAETGAEAADGTKLGRILVTHLHSYATPFIRYDLGDLGAMSERCPCGYDGPTLSHVHGRSKNMLKLPDGRLRGFLVRGSDLRKLVRFDEFRVRQVALDRIVVEIGGRDQLSPEERMRIESFIRDYAGEEFALEIILVKEIDWGPGLKRLGFKNELL